MSHSPGFTRPEFRCLGLLAFGRPRPAMRGAGVRPHMAVRSSVSQTRLHSRTKSASWIIGVHKVLYSVSNFYSKNSELQQPCSHGHWARLCLTRRARQNPLCPTYFLFHFCTFILKILYFCYGIHPKTANYCISWAFYCRFVYSGSIILLLMYLSFFLFYLI